MLRCLHMTDLLDEAIERLRALPEPLQDSVARAVILQLEEQPDSGDIDAIETGRRDFAAGNYEPLDHMRHALGLGGRE